jgi:hypothetical protein
VVDVGTISDDFFYSTVPQVVFPRDNHHDYIQIMEICVFAGRFPFVYGIRRDQDLGLVSVVTSLVMQLQSRGRERDETVQLLSLIILPSLLVTQTD